MHTSSITVAAAAAFLAALPVNAGLYPKSSAVLQVDGKSYDRLIAQSNYTSIVEFYAPWCGHCKNLQPAYEKAAQNLAGLAKVAAVDCDEGSNKQFCGSMGVQGFPTLKIVKPGKKAGRPIVEDYQGPRTAKGIVEAVVDKIPNLVKKVEDKTLESFLAESNDTAKAILFTDKGKTSALMKAVAIEFKGSINVAQIRNTDKEKASLELFGISKYPTLILLPGGKEAEGIVYDGELKKEAIVKFLSQAAAPNPDPAPAKVKLPKSKDGKKASKSKEAFEKSSASQASEEGKTGAATATEEVLEEEATESPSPEVDGEKPAAVPPQVPPIPMIETEKDLVDECLGPKTGTCILVILPASPDMLAFEVVKSVSEVAHKSKRQNRNVFPFYALTQDNGAHAKLHEALGLSGDVEVIAVNGKRGWWRQLSKTDTKDTAPDSAHDLIENWVEAIKLGEGSKQKLPVGLIPEEVVEEVEEAPEETVTEEQEPVPEPAAEPVEEPVEKESHDEL